MSKEDSFERLGHASCMYGNLFRLSLLNTTREHFLCCSESYDKLTLTLNTTINKILQSHITKLNNNVVIS